MKELVVSLTGWVGDDLYETSIKFEDGDKSSDKKSGNFYEYLVKAHDKVNSKNRIFIFWEKHIFDKDIPKDDFIKRVKEYLL